MWRAASQNRKTSVSMKKVTNNSENPSEDMVCL
jgi:hypothetical protein